MCDDVDNAVLDSILMFRYPLDLLGRVLAGYSAYTTYTLQRLGAQDKSLLGGRKFDALGGGGM